MGCLYLMLGVIVLIGVTWACDSQMAGLVVTTGFISLGIEEWL